MTDERRNQSGLAPLPATALIRQCRIEALDFRTTADLQPQTSPLGQDRVLEAVRFATGIARSGYNLYVMGSPGIGKHRLVRSLLHEQAATRPSPPDLCYVADFTHPDRPRVLTLPAGRGRGLANDLGRLVVDLLGALPAAFQSDEYRRRSQEIHDEFKKREDDAAARLSQHAAGKNIALLHTPSGYNLAPQRDGKILSQSEFDALDESEKATIQKAMAEVKDELQSVLSRVPMWQREAQQRFRELDAYVTGLTATQLVDELKQRYQALPDVLDYLDQVRADIVDNGELFRTQDDGEQPDPAAGRFTRYRVNLLVDNGAAAGAPVVVEDNPSYQRLVGRIDHVAQMGTLTTNFTLIKPGSLHLANGGFLVLDADRLLTQPFAWNAIKRALRAGEVRIESIERLVGVMGATSLEPAPIRLDTKVVLIGDRRLYYLLSAYDPEFAPLFRVVADFNEDLPRSNGREQAFANLVATLLQQEGLLAATAPAVARVIDWAARDSRDANKLSLHLGRISELLQEADHIAREAGARDIDEAQVQAAIDAKIRRGDQLRSRLHEAILDNTLMIDTSGRQLGQVNGLTLISAGDVPFGTPVRITATARMGTGTLIDIETEAELSGSLHSKGVMILSAYLAARYARHQPLSVSASLVFEQSYGEIDGDSASLAELCALLSALGDLSIDQSLAVTGSVNQHGQVQAIGGVNEKIEGFFDVCAARGLSGEQGVIIPAANTEHLMLRADVRAAAGDGRFSIYAVSHVDQALALLTGMRAGMPDANGLYPPDTCNGRVQMRLFEWNASRRQFASGGVGSE